MHVQRFCPSRTPKCAFIPIAFSLFVSMSFFGVFSYRFVSWIMFVSSCNSPVASCPYRLATRRLLCHCHCYCSCRTRRCSQSSYQNLPLVTLGCHGELKVPQDGVNGAILFGDGSLQGARLPVEDGLEPVEALSEAACCQFM
jgi:hypothetical protein